MNIDNELSTVLKVKSNNTKYKPLQMTDQSVYDDARHYYTLDEIADRYSVNKQTVLLNHHAAFLAGKANAMQKPRMLLNRIFDDFANLPDGSFARSDIPVNNLIKAMEVHARKYEGYGQTSRVEVTQNQTSYDAVEAIPLIIERPEI